MKTNKPLVDRMDQWIDEHEQLIVSEVQAFCRIKSVCEADQARVRAPYGQQMREMLDFALMRGASYGFEVQDHEGHCGSIIDGNINHAIGIFGHLDVVPEGEGWVYPPYGATRDGDFLIGRGVADNKGACVMGLMLMRMFKDLHISLRHGLRLVLGCAEETGMPDMEHFTQTQIMPEVSLVPDMRFPVNYAQKGMLRALVSIDKGGGGLLSFSGGEAPNMVPPHARAELAVGYEALAKALGGCADTVQIEPMLEGALLSSEGIAAHAANPESGKSAIFTLADALATCGALSGDSLEAMRSIRELCSDHYGRQAGIDCEDPETGKTTMVVGLAKTREERIYLNVDCRLSIAADLEQVERDFGAHLKRMGFKLEWIKISKPFYMPKDDPRVLALMDVYQELTGDDSPAYTAGGGTYSRMLENAVTFGPGFPEALPRPAGLPEHHGGAHAPDEYVHIPTMLRAMKIYAAAILELDQI